MMVLICTNQRLGISMLVALMLCTVCLFHTVSGRDKVQGKPIAQLSRSFDVGEPISIWASRVGPHANPSETYDYYSLPWCQPPDGPVYKPLASLGEALTPQRAVNTSLALAFAVNVRTKVICTRDLSQEEIKVFREAVKRKFYWELLLDGVMVPVPVGDMENRFFQRSWRRHRSRRRGANDPTSAEDANFNSTVSLDQSLTHNSSEQALDHALGDLVADMPSEDGNEGLDHIFGNFSSKEYNLAEHHIHTHLDLVIEHARGRIKRVRTSHFNMDTSDDDLMSNTSAWDMFDWQSKWDATLDVTEQLDERLEEPTPVSVTFTYSVRWYDTEHTASLLAPSPTGVVMPGEMSRWQSTWGWDNELRLGRLGSIDFDMHNKNVDKRFMKLRWASLLSNILPLLLLHSALTCTAMRPLIEDLKKMATGVPLPGGESGWKCLHGDVFRPPRNKAALFAKVGAGVHLLVFTAACLCLGLAGAFDTLRQDFATSAAAWLFIVCAAPGAFAGAHCYRRWCGHRWHRQLLLQCCELAGSCVLLRALLDPVATAYSSSAALPGRAVVAYTTCWGLGVVPLTVAAGLLGLSRASLQDPPAFNDTPRDIPSLPWRGWAHRSSWERCLPLQMALSGALAFVPVCAEMYYVLSTVWGHKDSGRQIWLNWWILAVLAVVVVVMVAMSTVWAIHTQLAVEDHRWWWPAFCCGGASAVYVYAFCVYFYVCESAMHGWLQAVFYFGSMALACYWLFLMLGAVGFGASLLFVRRLYAFKVE